MLSHRRVNLVGALGESLKQTVTLTPEAKYAFKLKEVTTKRGQHIKYHLNEIEDDKGVRYELAIENTKQDTGPYFDTMYLLTDSTYEPEIKIQVFGNIKKPPVPQTN